MSSAGVSKTYAEAIARLDEDFLPRQQCRVDYSPYELAEGDRAALVLPALLVSGEGGRKAGLSPAAAAA